MTYVTAPSANFTKAQWIASATERDGEMYFNPRITGCQTANKDAWFTGWFEEEEGQLWFYAARGEQELFTTNENPAQRFGDDACPFDLSVFN